MYEATSPEPSSVVSGSVVSESVVTGPVVSGSVVSRSVESGSVDTVIVVVSIGSIPGGVVSSETPRQAKEKMLRHFEFIVLQLLYLCEV